MGDKTHIQWTNATWNPVTGCSKVSPGCTNCYAERQALGRLKGTKGYPGLPWTPENRFENVILHPDKLDQPLRWKKPRMIFVNSMSDLFHDQVPDEFICRVWAVMALASNHTFQILTKRPQRMAQLIGIMNPADIEGVMHEVTNYRYPCADVSQWPLPNVWLGVSVESQDYAWRLDYLAQTPAAVRFISAEPLLGPLNLTKWLRLERKHRVVDPFERALNWTICGGESGPQARPMNPDWARSLRNQCQAAGVPFFMKQDSGPRPGLQGRLPDDLWRLKEIPTI